MQSRPPLVHTRLGAFAGTRATDAEQFLGIPFALPPVGERRFAPAVLRDTPWSGVRNATFFGSPCHQTSGYWDEDPFEHPQKPPFVPKPSEDCLHLNVWRPAATESDAALLPVLFWVHGGGFVGGSGSEKWTDGATLSGKQGVLVVTTSYRLGPLGFFAHPELQRAYGANGGANGLHDQIVALRWVQAHIASFGGDPRRVTLMGESSGGISVCVLNAAPEAAGLFERVAISSGPCLVPSSGWGPHPAQYGLDLSAQLMERLNASSLAELRKLPPQALQWSNATLGSDNFAGYFLDGKVLPQWPREAYASGAVHTTSLLIGHTSKDGTAPFYGKAPIANATRAEWVTAMRGRWGAIAEKVMAQYPLDRYAPMNATQLVPPTTASYIDADADNRVGCPLWQLARLVANASHARRRREATDALNNRTTRERSPRLQPAVPSGGSGGVYAFEFAHLHPPCDAAFTTRALPWWVDRSALAGCEWASHGSDVHFLFGTQFGEDSLKPPPFPAQTCAFDAAEGELSGFVGASYAAFATTGAPPWPPFVSTAGRRPSADGMADGWSAAEARAEPAAGAEREGGVGKVEGAAAAAEPPPSLLFEEEGLSTHTMKLATAGSRRVMLDYKAADCAFWASVSGAA